jgi:hypothetical protein
LPICQFSTNNFLVDCIKIEWLQIKQTIYELKPKISDPNININQVFFINIYDQDIEVYGIHIYPNTKIKLQVFEAKY